VPDRDICRIAYRAYEEELLDRYATRSSGHRDGFRYRLHHGRQWRSRDRTVAIIRMCQGLGVTPTETPSVDMLVTLYERLVKAEEKAFQLNR
jgi:hypothetical protein